MVEMVEERCTNNDDEASVGLMLDAGIYTEAESGKRWNQCSCVSSPDGHVRSLICTCTLSLASSVSLSFHHICLNLH